MIFTIWHQIGQKVVNNMIPDEKLDKKLKEIEKQRIDYINAVENLKKEVQVYTDFIEKLLSVLDKFLKKFKTRKVIDALKKQIPKKPNYIFDGNEHRVLCPTCKHFDFDMGLHEWARKYCGECGQAIDWGEVDG